jgi:NAD+ kinase
MSGKKIAFLVDSVHDAAHRVEEDAKTCVRDLGYTIVDEVEDADLLVTIGGDGTLLRGARLAYPIDIPILGINTGRLGFLTELELDGDGKTRTELARVLSHDLVIEERSTLEACLEGGGSFVALNDVVVHRGDSARIVTFCLDMDGEHVANLPADGIVVATATGSTAYFLSAGGPIISPHVDAFGIAALLPHTLFARPLIVPTKSTIEVSVDSDTYRANLDTDGVTVAHLEPGQVVTIRRAPKPVRFARGGPLHYFSRLEHKLRWGVSIRGTSR